MSASSHNIEHAAVSQEIRQHDGQSAETNLTMAPEEKESSKNYKGFVAGIFSGVSKLTGESLLLNSDMSCISCSSRFYTIPILISMT